MLIIQKKKKRRESHFILHQLCAFEMRITISRIDSEKEPENQEQDTFPLSHFGWNF